jgi:hypothetical protein
MAIASDKQLERCVGLGGVKGAIMVSSLDISGRSFPVSTRETSAKRDAPKHGEANGAQMMYAWSMGERRTVPVVSQRVTRSFKIKSGECPPEVYLG